jgi:hypothetical protein
MVGGGNGALDGAAAALFAAGIAARTRRRVLWCVTRPDLFAPALAQAGLSPSRVIYVEAGDEKTHGIASPDSEHYSCCRASARPTPTVSSTKWPRRRCRSRR